MKALAQRLDGFTQLAAVKTEVESFAQTLENGRNSQQSLEQKVDSTSLILEQQRITTAVEMYGNLGLLMSKYRSTPENISLFYELEIIRQTGADEEEPEPITPGEEIIAISNQATLKQITMIVSAPSGTIVINWGDENEESITLDGTEQVIRHNYAATGTYMITVSGDLDALTIFRMNQCNLTSLEIPESMTEVTNLEAGYNFLTAAPELEALTKLNYVHFGNCSLSEEAVDNILMDIDSYGTSGGKLYLHDGSNAAPGADGVVAKNSLVARGWTVKTK